MPRGVPDCPPPQPKLTAPLSLMEYLIHHLVEDSLTAAVVEAALVLGFWFLLRSIKYLTDDDGVYDPGLTVHWENLVFLNFPYHRYMRLMT